MYKICGTAVAALITVLLLRQAGSSYGELVIMFFGICVITHAVIEVAAITDFLKRLTVGSSVEEHLKTLMKATAIALASEFTADLCRDAGVGNVGSYVELFGRFEILLLSLPLITELLELSFSLMQL